MNLTDEQIEAAAKAAYNAFHPTAERGFLCWDDRPQTTREPYRTSVRAAAPFLQASWEVPTEMEFLAAVGDLHHGGFRDGFLGRALERFVQRRNAALIPKPVDPRREKILRVMRDSRLAIIRELLADRILAALDAKE